MKHSPEMHAPDRPHQLPEVLIVDDDDVDIMAVRRALGKLDDVPRTHVAHDGAEALEMLRQNNKNPDGVTWPCLVLLDINMPRMNGFDFLEAVRADENLHNLVVFMLSTSDSPRDKARAYGYNVAGYINKARPDGKFSASMSMLGQYCSVVDLPDRP